MWKKFYLVFFLMVGCGYIYFFNSADLEKKETLSFPEKSHSSIIDNSNYAASLNFPTLPVEKIEVPVSHQPTVKVSLPETESVHPEKLPAFDAQALAKEKDFALSRSAMIDQRFAQDSSKPVFEAMDNLFQEEKIDAEWAYINEQNIHEFFRENVNFSTFSPDSVQCKSHSCRVVISSSDKKTGDDIRADIAQQILETNADIPTGIMSVIDPKTARLIIYLQESEI